MGAYTLNKPTAAAVVAVLNPKSWTNPTVTFQNATGAAITITVTNQNVQDVASPTFADPPAGTLTVADGAIGVLETPHVAAQIAGTGTGDIYIVQCQ